MEHFKVWLSLSIAAVVTGWLLDKTASEILDAIYFTGIGILAARIFCSGAAKAKCSEKVAASERLL